MNKHAYLVMAHNNYRVIEKCLLLLDAPYNEFYIHVDVKVKNFPAEHFQNLLCHSKVHIYNEINVNWAGYSQVQCEMFLLEQAQKGNYSFYHLLSGADMPLQCAENIYQFFEEHTDELFVDFQDEKLGRHYKQYRNRIAKFHLIQEYRKRFASKTIQSILTFIAKSLLGIQIVCGVDRLKAAEISCGSQWFSIPHSFATYLIDNRERIHHRFCYTQCPDEHVMQMMVRESPFEEKVYRDESGKCSNMRYIKWQDEIDPHPITFRREDIDALLKSQKCFARKFDEKIDYSAVEALYTRLKGLEEKSE